MSSEENCEVCHVLSEELQQTDDLDTIRFVLQAFPPRIWPKLTEIARLRIENKLIKSIGEGRFIKNTDRCLGGALGTWATNIIKQFTLEVELWRQLFSKLSSSNPQEQDYVFHYFLYHVQDSYDKPPVMLVRTIKEGLKAGDTRFARSVTLWRFLCDNKPDNPWVEPFAEALTTFTPALESQEITDDDVPF